MERALSTIGLATFLAILCLSAQTAHAQGFWFWSDFDQDIPGLPPAVGGPGQPSLVFNTGVLVRSSANGLTTQPLTVDDASCNDTYYGGVVYDFPAPVVSGLVRVELTLATNQLLNASFVDTTVSGTSTVVTRVIAKDDGTLADRYGTRIIGNYAADTPVRLRIDIDMDADTWAATVDDELDGFDDDLTESGLPFVNDPSLIPQVAGLILKISSSAGTSCAGSRVIAFDDVLIATTGWLFYDGFESGDLAAWSAVSP